MSLPTDLIEPKVAARLLRCNVSTIYRWILKGKLRAWRRGGTRHLVRRADVEGMLVEEVPAMPLDGEQERERRGREAAERLRAGGMRF